MEDGIFEKVVAGEVRLLSAEQICERLGVSRTTFDRWVRNSDSLEALRSGSMKVGDTMRSNLDMAANFSEGRISFPKPDVRIGKSPRWQFETVVQWLKQNSSAV
jgi:predicted DNA-binding transcriptional regulator AlpA